MAGAKGDLLGLTVRDDVTGFVGMVTSQTRYLTGCDRICIEATDDPLPGEEQGDGFAVVRASTDREMHVDVLRVSVIEGGRVYRPDVPPVVGG